MSEPPVGKLANDPKPANAPASTPAKPALTEEQRDFVVLITQHFLMHGEVPSADRVEEQYKLPAKLYKKWIDKDSIRAALNEQGVKVSTGDEPTWRNQSLSAKQLIVANAMLDIIDTRSDAKKLKDLGVSTSTYQSWLRDPAFAEYLRVRSEGLLDTSQHEAHLALLDRVRAGEVKAIQYFNELKGRFTPSNGRVDNGGVNDVQALLTAILEIILEEVDDPLVAQRIAERFKTMMTARNTAQVLVDSTALPVNGVNGVSGMAVPEVVPTRNIEVLMPPTDQD